MWGGVCVYVWGVWCVYDGFLMTCVVHVLGMCHGYFQRASLMVARVCVCVCVFVDVGLCMRTPANRARDFREGTGGPAGTRWGSAGRIIHLAPVFWGIREGLVLLKTTNKRDHRTNTWRQGRGRENGGEREEWKFFEGQERLFIFDLLNHPKLSQFRRGPQHCFNLAGQRWRHPSAGRPQPTCCAWSHRHRSSRSRRTTCSCGRWRA